MADGILGSFLSGLGSAASTAGGALSPQVYQDNAQALAQQKAQQQAQIQQAAQSILQGVQNGSIPPDQGNAALQRLNQAFQGVQMGPSPQAQLSKMQLDQMQAGMQALPSLYGQSPGMAPSAMGPQGATAPQAAQQGQPGMAPPAMAPSPQQAPQGMPPEYLAYQQMVSKVQQLPPTVQQSPYIQKALAQSKAAAETAMQAARLGAEQQRLGGTAGPKIQTFIQGDKEVQRQWNPVTKQWDDIPGSVGPRFSKQVISVNTGSGEGGKGWVLGTVGQNVVRVNANQGTAQQQQSDGSWKKIPIPNNFVQTTAGTAGMNMPSEQDNTARGIAEYKLAPLSSFAMARPGGRKTMDNVMAINPDYDATLYYRKNRAEGDMGSGKTATLTRSFNVFIQHTDVMRDAAAALGNNNMQAVNTIANKISQWTGGTPPTTFDAIKKIYGDELVKAIIGTGGDQSDREAAANAVSTAQSPKQLTEVMDHFDKLMAGQVTGVKTQYTAATGKNDFDQFLLPKTKAVLSKYGYGTSGGNAPSATDLKKKYGLQ